MHSDTSTCTTAIITTLHKRHRSNKLYGTLSAPLPRAATAHRSPADVKAPNSIAITCLMDLRRTAIYSVPEERANLHKYPHSPITTTCSFRTTVTESYQRVVYDD